MLALFYDWGNIFVRLAEPDLHREAITSRPLFLMGARDDPPAVVDSETRVIGLEALRVAGSSIMPSITSGNLNAPTIMIGEKAADMILGRDPLPASNAPFHVATDWKTRQR